MIIIGIILAILSGIELYNGYTSTGGYDAFGNFLASIVYMIPACTFILIGELYKVYNKFVSIYYRPADKKSYQHDEDDD